LDLRGRKWREDGENCNSEELQSLNISPNIIRMMKSMRMRGAGHVASMGEIRNAYKILVGKPEGKISRGRPRCRWKDNIRTDLR